MRYRNRAYGGFALQGSSSGGGGGGNGVVEANGFTWVSPTTPPTYAPDSSPETLTWATEGFTATGGVTAYSRDLVKTQRIREPFPLQNDLTPFDVALSDYVYATCTSPGVTNNSAMVSPQPVANWALPHRLLVGNTLTVEVTAHHRDAQNGKQVACVVFTATDGTLTVTQTVSATVISPEADDLVALEVYRAALDITTLANGLITVNAKVYPWYGVAASINDSALNGTSDLRFTARYYNKNVSRFAAPPLAYVNTAGNDATGVWSTNPVTAAATPFLSIGGALIAMTVGANATVTGSICDGCEIRIGAGIATAQTNLPGTSRPQNIAAIVITRDPAVSRANAQFTWGAAGNFRSRVGQSGLNAALTEGLLHLRDISIVRTGTGNFAGETLVPLKTITIGCNFNNGSVAVRFTSSGSYECYGTVFTGVNTSPSPFAASVANPVGRVRSSSFTTLASTSVESYFLLGNVITTCAALQITGANDGAIRFCNKFVLNYFAGGATFSYAFSTDTVGAVHSQNVMECTEATTSGVGMAVSHDGATADSSHIIMHSNSATGFFLFSRANMFYDDGGTPRTNILQSIKGNIFSQLNTKGDVFTSNGARLGNWGFLYGVGCQGNFTQWIDAGSGGIGTSFAQMYPGLGCNYGTSATVRNDPLFVNYQGTTNSGATAIAGAGGGDYNVTSSSPAKGMVSNAVFAFDIAGTARLTTADTAGAYKAP